MNSNSKILAIDLSEIFYQSCFVWYAMRKKVPFLLWKYYFMKKLKAIIKRYPDREVYGIGDGKHIWRKEIFPAYKKKRKDFRDKYPEMKWKQKYAEFEILKKHLDEFTRIAILKEDTLESDDIVAVLSSLNSDIVIVSSDHDMHQLCVYPKVQIVSAKTMELKKIDDPEGERRKMIKSGCTTDEVPSAKTPEELKRNKLLVDLVELPSEVTQKVLKILNECGGKTPDKEAFLSFYNYKLARQDNLLFERGENV